MTSSKFPRRPATIRLSHQIVVRTPALLPMLYTPSELSEEVGVAVETIRDWVQHADVPHERDGSGHIWIHGRRFADWVANAKKTREARRLEDDQALCVACRSVVKLQASEVRIQGKHVRRIGVCPECGSQVYRAVRHHGRTG